MSRYEHTQSKITIAVLVFAVALATLIPPLATGDLLLLITPLMLLLIALLGFAMSQLTTTVDDRAVHVSFRWGRPQRTIPLADIAGARAARDFRIGTDDPEGLAAAIQSRLGTE